MAAGRTRWGGRLALLGLLTVAAAAAQADEAPLLVVYGQDAPTREGDEDHREVIYVSVPAALAEPLYLRLFDPDIGGRHDLAYGGPGDASHRFALYGGPGAFSQAGPDAPLERQLAAGELLAERRFGEQPELDDQWRSFAPLRADQGELIGDRRWFRLVVEGEAGNDGNLYGVALSLRPQRNLAPDGVRMLAYAPTVRVPDRRALVELRFQAPDQAGPLAFANFDAASGRVELATRYRALPLAASGQDEWAESALALHSDERGAPAALTFQGGDEIPNDATFRIADGAGALVPIELPPQLWRPTRRPLPVATAAPLADCASVAFDAGGSSDPDGERLSFAWDFGDGTTAEGRSVVHRYARAGRHDAVLRVLDESGQIGAGAELPVEVVLRQPPTAVLAAPPVVAAGESVPFNGAGSTGGERPVARHLWSFGDGSTAEGVAPAHRFEAPGRYRVSLRVEDDSDHPCNFGTDERLVVVNAAPVAEAGTGQRVAAGDLVVVDGGRSYDVDGAIVEHGWDFGDGATATGARAEHRYAAPGRYTVTLTARDDAGVANSASSDSVMIVVNAPPVAAAGPDRRVATGEVVAFDATGSSDPDGRIVDWLWDFGDGGQARGAKVAYAYPTPGEYRVGLTVRDDSGTATSEARDRLTVLVNAPPVAVAGPAQVVTSSEVRFDGSGSSDPDGAIARYEWDFGDGGTGSGAMPTHVYAQPGTYQVRLTVTDDSGTVRSSASDLTEVVVNAAPIADAGPDLVAAPGQTITLRGSSSLDPDGDVATFAWDLKDGTEASGPEVSHAFAEPGAYRVRLRVGDDTGQARAFGVDEALVVVNAPPVARAGPDLLAAPGAPVRLDGGGSFDPDGRIATWRWDFSDGAPPAEGAVVERSFAEPGIYTAQLTVIDASGALNSTARDEATIQINGQPSAVAGPDVQTSETTLRFDGTGSRDPDGDPLTYRWNFGDGATAAGPRVSHNYGRGGQFPVVLTVDDGSGLPNSSDQAALRVVIDRPPVAVAGASRRVCAGDVVVLDGSASSDPDGGLLRYEWDFGDGTKEAIVNPTKVYKSGAVYPVTLTVHDEADGSHRDQIAITVDEAPLANAGPDQRVCVNREVQFDGSASTDFDGVVNRFAWNFGDGSNGGGDRPRHTYGTPGDYRVVLTIWGDETGQCDASSSDEMTIRVIEAPVAVINAPGRAPVGVAVAFDATGSSSGGGEILKYRWDFGDGATAEGARVEHRYAAAGVYQARLSLETAGTETGCDAVVASQRIVVNAPPVAVAAAMPPVAVGQEVVFDGAGSRDPDGAIASHRWDFGDGASGTGVQARHRYGAPGRYEATLTVTDDAELANSSADDVITVTVNAPPEPEIAAPAAACPGEPVRLDAGGSRDPDGTIATFEWLLGDGASAEGTAVEHAYRRSGIYDVGLAVDDGAGLPNSRREASLRLRVNQAPVAVAGPDRRVCPGEPIRFDGTGSVDRDGRLTQHVWDFGDGTVIEGAVVEHRFAAPGIYQARLAVSDDSGSSCALGTDVATVVVNSPPQVVIGGERSGFVGGAHDELLLDAAGSSDPDGEALGFAWDLGDGARRAGELIHHGYAAPGEYRVRLTAQDTSGLPCGVASDKVTVKVEARE
jgi:PKD repeat protein